MELSSRGRNVELSLADLTTRNSHGGSSVCTVQLNPRLSHEKSVKRIVKYLKRHPDRGIIYKVDKSQELECHVDADFAGNWDQADSENTENFRSCTGYLLSYVGYF